MADAAQGSPNNPIQSGSDEEEETKSPPNGPGYAEKMVSFTCRDFRDFCLMCQMF